MNQKKFFTPLFIVIFSLTLSPEVFPQNNQNKKKQPKITYQYRDRDHTTKENFKYLGAMFGVSIGAYYITQPGKITRDGSLKNWRKNFGKVVQDKDESVWNWMVHPYSGSQLFLFYRANGYSRINSLFMTFIQSTLFEFFIETYTEPASLQDLYQTPVWGAMLGIFIERFSLYLLNSNMTIGRVFGHLLNPSTLFWFYEGKVTIYPTIKNKNEAALTLNISF